ncbi:hypothetical protein F441_06047 [Phytophthora nicotianae CJ01A1]|uniref:Uncharacterized protein n=3 Tax=Phytophthora nicotianae TaxID=4792 RepID=W2H532_PHYNI|nr:hypothetical protein L915_05913 [Phytophthora nicotianae]ETL43702.1 hypothetical protein L916_05848 [Phytophthora nicotianae]ETL96868.1 hypothetical protein L917_05738 [Phytophthora nicotianae]ETP20175.1 hypothetical protein F441_06047 [Phytophthora nicotianae CJ01A1]KUF81746.1 hypothetical protein AM587_10006395 [Phytophthora nicotianae]
MATPVSTGSQRKFGPKWELKYAVAVTERDQLTQLPTKAVCLMCQAFEREEAVGAKRKKTSRVRSFSAPWRPDNMKRHMEQQHPMRWEEYQKLPDGEKRAYFSSREDMVMPGGDVAVSPMVSEPTPSAEAYTLAAQYRAFLIDKDIVEELIAGVLFKTTNDEYQNAWNVPLTFSLLEEASTGLNNADVDVNESRYVARVESLLKFNMCLKYVAMGISFSQVVPLFQKTTEETGMDMSLSGSAFTEQQLACLCRVVCAVNFQTLKDALRRVWAFTIALEKGNGAGSPYLDVRVRFERDGRVFDFHLISVPIREDSPQITQHQGELIVKCLDVVAPGWKSQLIGVSTSDSFSKMPSCARVLVNRLAQSCVASIYCEWGLVLQLEQAIQESFNGLCNQRFMSGLTVLVGHFRRQRVLIREMNGDLCPKFEDGQWRSITNVLEWFVSNRARLVKCVQDTQPTGAPGKEWWITVLAVNSIMERVDGALTMLRGPSAALRSARRAYVAKLVTDLAVMTGALGPLAVSQQATDTFEFGDFSVSREATLSFLKEQGSFVINAVNELEVDFPACCQAAVESTANFAVSVIARAHQIMLEGDENGNITAAPSAAMPPFLPQTLCKTRNQVFATHLQSQRVRLLQHFSADQIELIEDQHRMLRTSYQLDEHVSQQINALPATCSFTEAWKDARFGGNDCKLLREFCGAIACAATDPVVLKNTTEADFLLINWRRSPFGLSLVDFSLEAVLHAQQYRALSRLREC